MSTDEDEWRVQFDADVTFRNGGGLQAQGFRLDIPGTGIDRDALGELFVRHLGLLMVDQIRITNQVLLRELHKGSRGVPAGEPDRRSPRVVDLSHLVRDGMITYPGLPAPSITEHLSREASRAVYAPGTEFQIGHISMVANTGTYLDAPSHRFAEGADLAALPLERTVDLEGLVVRVLDSQARGVDRALLAPLDVTGRAVLIHTGWDRHWETAEYGSDAHPFVTADAAAWLAEHGAALVGIDSINIDDKTDGTRPAHTTLLRAGIPIVEHLCGLDQLPAYGFRFFAAPLAVDGMGTISVRAYALVD